MNLTATTSSNVSLEGNKTLFPQLRMACSVGDPYTSGSVTPYNLL